MPSNFIKPPPNENLTRCNAKTLLQEKWMNEMVQQCYSLEIPNPYPRHLKAQPPMEPGLSLKPAANQPCHWRQDWF